MGGGGPSPSPSSPFGLSVASVSLACPFIIPDAHAPFCSTRMASHSSRVTGNGTTIVDIGGAWRFEEVFPLSPDVCHVHSWRRCIRRGSRESGDLSKVGFASRGQPFPASRLGRLEATHPSLEHRPKSLPPEGPAPKLAQLRLQTEGGPRVSGPCAPRSPWPRPPPLCGVFTLGGLTAPPPARHTPSVRPSVLTCG